MSEVKRYECLLIEDAPRLQAILPQGAVVCSERTQMMVTAEDYATLEAEAQALREELKNRTAECNGLHEMLRQEHDRTEKAREEVAALRRFAGEIYQVLGALDAPENVLDNASDAANGDKLRHKTLLPFAALRARVVVVPDFDNDVIIETFRRNGFLIELGASYSVKGQIAQLLNALEELARLNGKAVSEADLNLARQWYNACVDVSPRYLDQQDHDAAKRIVALLGEGKEVGNVLVRE